MNRVRLSLALAVAALAVEPVACTKAQDTAIVTASRDACEVLALASSFIPAATPATIVLADIIAACPELVGAEATILADILALEGVQADAGSAPVGQYVPTPMAHRAAKR